jgi:ATP-dependent Clp protease ATP-binding subunit ClpA
MFERYTEKARRAIFFSRYEASQFGSPYIESEHILLGLLRENHEIARLLGSEELIRNEIEARAVIREKVSTTVDLPLSNECKRILAYASEEAERLAHRHIGTEHLFLGLLREKGCFAAEILHGQGVALEKLREHYARISPQESGNPPRTRTAPPIKIHGLEWNGGTIRERVRVLQQSNFYWQKREWKARDLAVREDGRLSFDVSLAQDAKKFDLRQAGWKIDHCAICEWDLFESEDQPDHSAGYSNGRDWVCTECYDKFRSGPDYFATAHPEIT